MGNLQDDPDLFWVKAPDAEKEKKEAATRSGRLH